MNEWAISSDNEEIYSYGHISSLGCIIIALLFIRRLLWLFCSCLQKVHNDDGKKKKKLNENPFRLTGR